MAGVINLDRISGAQLFSLKHSAALENGNVCNLGAIVAGEREVYDVATPATATLASAQVILVASPEVMYDETKLITDFTIPAGTISRGVALVPGNIVQISDSIIDGTTVVGQFVIAANTSLKLAASATASGKFTGRVIEKGNITVGLTNVPATTILVVSN